MQEEYVKFALKKPSVLQEIEEEKKHLIIVVAVINHYVLTNVLKFTIPNKTIGCKFIFN